MIKVSVIIPVYNVQEYLREMLDSICCQTLREIEIICVDDGSEDDSAQILAEYAKKDERMTVIRQKHSGAGAARNTGLEYAVGKYLAVLDADDFFQPDMLERAFRKCERDRADLCVFRSDCFDTMARRFVPNEGALDRRYLPKQVPFSPQEAALHIFQLFNGWSWDKLYNREFVVKSGLKFQRLRTSNDAFFVFLSNIQADRITIVDKVLAHHRINVKSSLSATREKSWDCCWKAVSAVRRELKLRGQYSLVEQSFINWALHFLLWNVHSLRHEAAGKLARQMREQYFRELEIYKYPESYFYDRSDYREYLNICRPDGMIKILWQAQLRADRIVRQACLRTKRMLLKLKCILFLNML